MTPIRSPKLNEPVWITQLLVIVEEKTQHEQIRLGRVCP